MQTHEKSTATNAEIRIYDNLKKALLLFIICLIFVTGGVFLIADERCRLDVKIVGGWLNIMFFGIGGLLVLGSTLYKRIRRIPSLIIRDDCVYIYVQMKNKYDIVMFSDIDGFRTISLHRVNMVLIDYKPAAMVKEIDRSSTFARSMMAFSFNTVNAIKGISTANLAINAEKLCSILNEKLARQREFNTRSM